MRWVRCYVHVVRHCVAGLDRGDELLSVAGSKLTFPEDLAKALADHMTGESVEVVFLRRGQETHVHATLADLTGLEIVPLESTVAPLSLEQRGFREAWLRSKVKQ